MAKDYLIESLHCSDCIHYHEPLDSDACEGCFSMDYRPNWNRNRTKRACTTCKFINVASSEKPCRNCMLDSIRGSEYPAYEFCGDDEVKKFRDRIMKDATKASFMPDINPNDPGPEPHIEENPVHHPSHYTVGDIEVIDYIRDKLSPVEFQGYCMGNVLKYVSRWRHKGGVEDLQKAEVYLDWLIESAIMEKGKEAAE